MAADYSNFTVSDLSIPWSSAIVERTIPSMPAESRWDGDPETYAAWDTEICGLLTQGGADCLAEHTRRITGSTIEAVFGSEVEIHSTYSPPAHARATQIKAQQAALIEQRKTQHCAAVVASLAPGVRSLIVPPGDADLHRDPDKLWGAITGRAHGTAALVGPRLMQSLYAVTWETKASDGSAFTVVQQLESIVAEYQALNARFAQAGDYKLPEVALVADLCHKIPAGPMRLHIAEFRQKKTLSELLVAMRPDAMSADDQAPTDLSAFVSVDRSAHAAAIEDMRAEIAALRALVASSGGRGDSPSHISDERRRDRAAGPPRSGWRWCDHHGWSPSHSTEACFYLHPELKGRK